MISSATTGISGYRFDDITVDIERLQDGIDDLDRSMQSYSLRMDGIRDQYPNLVLPSGTFEQFERWRRQWNWLNGKRNDLVTETNTLVEEHNALVETSNSLSEKTNRLIEELAWVP